MSITHEEARRLIQFNADEALNGFEKDLMENHLETCDECRGYAKSILKMELILQPMLQRRWDRSPLPLPQNKEITSSQSKLIQNMILATRIAAMGVICVAFLFNFWQFTHSEREPASQPSAIGLPAPTPSLQFTSTKASVQSCAPFHYQVQKGDTLASIARQFSVTPEEIMKENNLDVNSLNKSTQLVIYSCSLTPTHAMNTATTAFTSWSNTTSTPMGSPTQ